MLVDESGVFESHLEGWTAPERLNQSQEFDKWMGIRTFANQLHEALKVDQANAVVVRLQTVVVNKLY